MYERSAIVLERYMDKIFKFDKEYNLKKNYYSYNELIEEIENYQVLAEKENKVIQEFDDTVKSIEEIQKKQEGLCKSNQNLEESRNQLFMDLGEDSKSLENKFKKIENNIEQNNQKLTQLREEFVKYLEDFSARQKERNKCEKARRIGEANHISYINKVKEEFKSIDLVDVNILKQFVNEEKELVKKELNELMTKNGKNEKIGFNQDVLKVAIKARISIAEKEAECYLNIFDKMKKLLNEVDNDNLRLQKYKKALRDAKVKLNFLEAEKEYIVGFLDYERMTTIAGTRAHKKKMEEACQNFELDMIQIHNLYELLLKEISNKSTKKAYKELYNKTYLKNIQDKERNFEEEVNNIRIDMGTVINSNYWRIEGIKNVYNIFNEQIEENFEKDLSQYGIGNDDVPEEEDNSEIDYKEYDHKEYDDEEYDDEEYDDEEYDDEEYDDEEYDDEEYDDEEYDDEEYDDEEYDDEEYDDEEYDDDKYVDEEDDTEEIDDDTWEKEIMSQLNRKRTKGKAKKGNTSIFNKLFKDKKGKNSSKNKN